MSWKLNFKLLLKMSTFDYIYSFWLQKLNFKVWPETEISNSSPIRNIKLWIKLYQISGPALVELGLTWPCSAPACWQYFPHGLSSTFRKSLTKKKAARFCTIVWSIFNSLNTSLCGCSDLSNPFFLVILLYQIAQLCNKKRIGICRLKFYQTLFLWSNDYIVR